MTLTAKDVDEIVRLLDQSSFDELSLEIGDLKLRLCRSAATGIEQAPPAAAPLEPAPDIAIPDPVVPAADVADPSLHAVTSPLLGVFYRAPKPGAPPFVEIGTRVAAGDVIGIIEVMKLMNSVRADVAGEVVEILPQNGALVEYGEILIRVRAD